MLKSTVLYAEHAIRTAPPGTADAFTGGKIDGGGSEVTQKDFTGCTGYKFGERFRHKLKSCKCMYHDTLYVEECSA